MENAPVPHDGAPRPAVSPDHLELFTLPENRALLFTFGEETTLFLDAELGDVCVLKEEAHLDGTYEKIGTIGEVRQALLDSGWGIKGGTRR